MELYQLRTFVAVAREGSLSRAAEKLFTSQPAVSAQIKSLEEEFGLRLFERTPAGMVPTLAGEELWEEAERLLTGAKDLATRAISLRGVVSGTVRIGLNNDYSVLRVVDALAVLAQRHPTLRFDLVYGTSGSLRDAVLARELDLAFYEGDSNEPTVVLAPLTTFQLVVVLPAAWAAEVGSDWQLLASRPWASGTPGCSFYRHLQELALSRGVQPEQRFQVNDDLTAVSLAAAGLAVTLTTRSNLLTVPHLAERLVVWPHFERALPLSLCFAAARQSDPTIKAVVDAVRHVWSAPQPKASSRSA